MPHFSFCTHILHRTAFSLASHCLQCLWDKAGERPLCWAAARTASMGSPTPERISATAWFFSFSSLMVPLSMNTLYFFSPPPPPHPDEYLLFWYVEAHMCLWLHQYIYSRVPENVPKHWDTVICPVNKLLGSSLACTQPVRDCQLEISQRTRRHGWGIRNFQRHTLFHRIPFACSCPFLKVYRHY